MADEENKEEQNEEQNEEEEDEYMSMDQVMGELDIGKDDLEEMVSQGELQAYSSGEEMKFPEDEVSALKEENGGEEAPDEEGDAGDGEDEFMSMSQVMGELGVEKDDLEQMVSQGKLRAYRSDNKMKFREEDVTSLEESGRHEAITDSDTQEDVGDMTDIGDAIDQDVGAAEEEELDLEDIDVEDEEIDELAEDLMLEEEEEPVAEEDEKDTGGTEEMIFEEEDLSGGADEASDEEINLDDDEPLLDEEEESSDLTLEGDEDEAVDTGKTMQMDTDVAGKTLKQDEVDTTGTESETQRRRTTRRRTTQTARRTRSAAGTQSAVGKLWLAVIIIGVIIGLEGVLVGVDMVRVSTMSAQQENVEPWATSAPAEWMLNIASDRSMKPGSGQTTTENSSSSSSSETE